MGKVPGKDSPALLLGTGSSIPPRAVRTFPQTTSSSSPKRLCRVSLFPDVLHTRGATSFGSAWKTWRQAWRSRRCHRDDQYFLPLKKQQCPRNGHSKQLDAFTSLRTLLPVPSQSLQVLILPPLPSLPLTLMTR